jgi:hypothetical protein
MIRSLIGVLVCIGWSGAGVAAPEQKADAGSVCLYESKAYSEGAFVCVQKSLMQTCVADGARMLWKPVAEKEVNDRCPAPTVQYHEPEPRVHAHRRHFVVRRFHPPVERPAKCFVFKGLQYCE